MSSSKWVSKLSQDVKVLRCKWLLVKWAYINSSKRGKCDSQHKLLGM